MSNGQAAELNERFAKHDASIAVVGLGYVGLPLAVAFAESGFRALGLDVDAVKVEQLMAGESYVGDIESSAIAPLVETGKFEASTDFRRLAEADAVLICVPTPLSKSGDPDISYIVQATDEVARTMRPSQLVILESTTYPGTTDEIVLPRLERGGRKVGHDFYLAFSPERIDPGNEKFQVRNTPKVVGGVTETCLELSVCLYQQIIEKVVPVSSATTAEMAKILENTFRAVNIGLVNEVAQMCDRLGIDVWEVIEAAATKPFGFLPFYPGPGLGGHCIPIDPFYLSWKMRTLNSKARFIELAGEINSEMPKFVVQKVVDGLNDDQRSVHGSRVLLLGVAYKRDIGDVRESPAYDIAAELLRRRAEVLYHDPHVDRFEVEGTVLPSSPLDAELLKSADCVVIVTDHSSFDLDFVARHARLIVDTRNATQSTEGGARIIKL